MKPLPNHGGQLRGIAESFGIPLAQLVDFSANINPEGPPPAVIPKLIQALQDPATLTSYPDLDQAELKRSIAFYAGVSRNNLAVANGFVPLLDATLRALSIHHCLLPIPAFVEYRPALTRAGIRVTTHLLDPENSFAYDIDSLLIGDHDAIVLANPQNPTGIATTREHLLELVSRAAARNITILLDEAFIDYIPVESLTANVEQHPNLLVFRSLTKFHAIPGLRVAYMAAASSTRHRIEENLPPWSITTLAAIAAIAALPDVRYASDTRFINQQRSIQLRAGLSALGLHPYDAAANFILFRLPPSQDPIRFWQRMIANQQIVLRTCQNYENLSKHHLRTAVRTQDDNARLLAATYKTLAEL